MTGVTRKPEHQGFCEGCSAIDKTPEEMRDKAERYRLLASRTTDQMAIQALQELATRYDDLADKRERASSAMSARPA